MLMRIRTRAAGCREPISLSVIHRRLDVNVGASASRRDRALQRPPDHTDRPHIVLYA